MLSVKQTTELPVTCDAMTLERRHFSQAMETYKVIYR